jgi:hypothetical protein
MKYGLNACDILLKHGPCYSNKKGSVEAWTMLRQQEEFCRSMDHAKATDAMIGWALFNLHKRVVLF